MGGQWRLGAVISCERQRGLSPESASVQIKTSNCRHLYKQCIEDTLDLCYWKQTNTHRHSLFQHYPLLGQEFLCWKYTLERNRANSGPILRTSNPVPYPMRVMTETEQKGSHVSHPAVALASPSPAPNITKVIAAITTWGNLWLHIKPSLRVTKCTGYV